MISEKTTSVFTRPAVGKRRGPIPKSKVELKWSSDFAYAIGLIVSDGSVSKDGRHICFVSKDLEQAENFLKALKFDNLIGVSKGLKNREAYRVQFSDVYFWNYLVSIGISPAKSKTITKIDVPDEYFFDFVRGEFDGDGSFYSYIDHRWKGSLMFYISFASGSKDFIVWLQNEIYSQAGIKGHVTKPYGRNTTYQLRYAKQESLRLLEKMYEKEGSISLSRKRLKIKKILGTIATPCQARV
jgi:hypothetical protein